MDTEFFVCHTPHHHRATMTPPDTDFLVGGTGLALRMHLNDTGAAPGALEDYDFCLLPSWAPPPSPPPSPAAPPGARAGLIEAQMVLGGYTCASRQNPEQGSSPSRDRLTRRRGVKQGWVKRRLFAAFACAGLEHSDRGSRARSA